VKLNLDCIRSILIAIEEKPFNQTYTLDTLCGKIPTFSSDEIHYCCLILDEAGFLNVITVPLTRSNVLGIKSIGELSFSGHEFLESIRQENHFLKVKSYCRKIGSYSFDCILDISKELLRDSIRNALLP